MKKLQSWLAVASLVLAGGLYGGVANAATVNLGFFSFDSFIPPGPGDPGVNAIGIANLTGAAALPPDFAATTGLTFENLEFILDDGLSLNTITIGDFGPGSDVPDALKLADTLQLVGLTLRARLSQQSFGLSDGTTFQAASRDVSITLLPSSGQFLTPDLDFAVISVESAQGAIPEPATGLLVACAIVSLAIGARRNRLNS